MTKRCLVAFDCKERPFSPDSNPDKVNHVEYCYGLNIAMAERLQRFPTEIMLAIDLKKAQSVALSYTYFQKNIHAGTPDLFLASLEDVCCNLL